MVEGFDPWLVRLATGLGGGVGGTREELCGGLSGGLLVIGARYGRADPGASDQPAYRLSARYREKFIEEFGMTRCQDLRDSGFGSKGHWPCSALIERAARVLLDVLEEESGD